MAASSAGEGQAAHAPVLAVPTPAQLRAALEHVQTCLGRVSGATAGALKDALAKRLAKKDLFSELAACSDLRALETLRTQVEGRKAVMTHLLHSVGTVEDLATRKDLGQAIQALKQLVHALFAARLSALKQSDAQLQSAPAVDITLPAKRPQLGSRHPLTQVTNDILRFFNSLGFKTVIGPELESDYYNFAALNIPAGHPARAEQDSFYLNPTTLLRTQTSNMQIRTAELMQPPIAIVSPGRVYRRDTLDATHSYTFHQVEGMYIDKQVSFAELKGILIAFCHAQFGKDIRVRFRPDYFPFTEPSCEISIGFTKPSASKQGVKAAVQWLEILGAGLMNPVVLENVGIDSQNYSGFAFGMGVERLAMLKYGINDIRVFHENESAFLTQFS